VYVCELSVVDDTFNTNQKTSSAYRAAICVSAPSGEFKVVFHCLFISQALNYCVLAVKNFRLDYGRCGPIGIHCTLRGDHLYSTPEVTEEHEIGKQLKHHFACDA